MKKSILFALVVSVLGADINVLVSKDSDLNSVTKKELSNVYLKKTNKIDGQEVTVVNNKDDYNEFNKKVLNKTSSQIHAYWMKQVFLGRKVPPKTINKSEVKLEIKKNPNSIVYTSEKLDEKIIYEVK